MCCYSYSNAIWLMNANPFVYIFYQSYFIHLLTKRSWIWTMRRLLCILYNIFIIYWWSQDKFDNSPRFETQIYLQFKRCKVSPVRTSVKALQITYLCLYNVKNKTEILFYNNVNIYSPKSFFMIKCLFLRHNCNVCKYEAAW